VDRRRIARLVVTLVSAFAAVGAIAAILLAVSFGPQSSGTTTALPFGWTLPLAAAAIVGGVTWLLLGEEPRNGGPVGRAVVRPCPACGSEVRTDWRLCPFCGERLERSCEVARPVAD
jgi:hypothetical protein